MTIHNNLHQLHLLSYQTITHCLLGPLCNQRKGNLKIYIHRVQWRYLGGADDRFKVKPGKIGF